MATTRKTRSTGTAARRSAAQSAAQRARSTGDRGNSAGRSSRQSTPDRDSQGRFKADHHVRNAAVGAAVAVGAVAAGIAAAFRFGLLDRLLPAGQGHGAEDLLIDDADQAELRAGKSRGNGRAPADFRPDMDAPLSQADKEALRPAKGQRAADLAGAGNGAVEAV